MKLNRITLAAQVATLLLSYQHVQCADKPPKTADADNVRKMLGGSDFGRYRDLVEMGTDLFPAFEELLKDPNTKDQHVKRIFSLLKVIKGDRSKFIKYATDRLGDTSRDTRRCAAELLGVIASERDTSSLLVLLSDGEMTVAHSAASSLVKIGGSNDLAAINVWLSVSNHGHFTPERQASQEVLLKHVTKCRDELKERLDKAKKK